jgi:uncharacterized repeat protein (TIGR02543 family)
MILTSLPASAFAADYTGWGGLQPISQPTVLEQKVDGTTVRVSADPGVLATGTTLSVTPLTGEEASSYLGAIEERESIEFKEALVFDIHLQNPEGNLVQPNGDVRVAFEGMAFEEGNEAVNVYHFDTSEQDVAPAVGTMSIQRAPALGEERPAYEQLETVLAGEGVEVTSSHFSIYVVGTGETTTTSNRYWMSVGDTVDLQSDKAKSNKTWQIYTGEDCIELQNQNDAAGTVTVKALSEGEATVCYGRSGGFGGWDYFYIHVVNGKIVTFDANGGYFGTGYNSQETKRVVYTTNALLNSQTIPTPTRSSYNASYAFAGWATTAEATEPNVDPAVYTVGENVTLYAVWKQAYTVTFNANTGYTANSGFVDEYGDYVETLAYKYAQGASLKQPNGL